MVQDQSWGRQFLERSASWNNLQRQTLAFSNSQLHGEASTVSRAVSTTVQPQATLERFNYTERSPAINSLAGTRTMASWQQRRRRSHFLQDFFCNSIYEHGRGVLPIASTIVSGQAQTERNGNGTEMQRWCAGDRTANGRARVPFWQNGTERKRHRFYASYCK